MITDYAHLPLGTYIAIQNVCADASLEDEDQQIKVIALLAGKTEREILALPLVDYSRLCRQAAFLHRPVDDLPANPATSYVAQEFELIPTDRLEALTTAQYIDFQAFCAEPEKNFVEILSVFLIPKGKTYGEGYDVAQVRRAISEDISITQAVALSAFFLTKFAGLIADTLASLESAARRRKDKAKLEAITAMRTRFRAALSGRSGAGSTT